MIAKTPIAPYYAVIFSSVLTAQTKNDSASYETMADKMVELAKRQPGFLGIESAREDLGITVSYWQDIQSIKTWKLNAEHLLAQQKGRETWYQSYKVRISKVERDYSL